MLNTMEIKVIVKAPGEEPFTKNISAEDDQMLSDLQGIVDGWIEVDAVNRELFVICDKEGKLKNLEKNCYVDDIGFCGTIVISGRTPDGQITDAPELREVLPLLEDY